MVFSGRESEDPTLLGPCEGLTADQVTQLQAGWLFSFDNCLGDVGGEESEAENLADIVECPL